MHNIKNREKIKSSQLEKLKAKKLVAEKAKETKPKEKSPTVERKTTSIFSKIKKLASKKSK